MGTDLRKKAKNGFEKYFLKLMNNAVLVKSVENVRKHKDINLVATERRRNCLVLQLNYRIKKFFRKKLLAIEMKKKQRYL